jgi:hypothetical protein
MWSRRFRGREGVGARFDRALTETTHPQRHLIGVEVGLAVPAQCGGGVRPRKPPAFRRLISSATVREHSSSISHRSTSNKISHLALPMEAATGFEPVISL